MPRGVLSACRVVEPYNPSTLTQSMALSPGIRLGAYEVLALLGAGGMGEETQSVVTSRQSPESVRKRLMTETGGSMTYDLRLRTTSRCR